MSGYAENESGDPQTIAVTPAQALELLTQQVQSLVARQPGRVAIGLAGGPGVGKSTLAAGLVAALNRMKPGFAALVPMDGFHMHQIKLDALGIARDKGAPHTFEAGDFVDFLARLKAASGPVSGPAYSRKIEDVIENAFTIDGAVEVLVVEGNYLLLSMAPWWQVKPLLDFTTFIHVPRETVRTRLLKRHAEEGLFSEARNREHVERVDLANYDLVGRSKPRADVILDLITDT